MNSPDLIETPFRDDTRALDSVQGAARSVALAEWENEGGTVKVPTSTAIQRVAMLGNRLPRQCGIATFTTDLSDALEAERPAVDCFVMAMNDVGRRHAYPKRVRYEIADDDLASYGSGAAFLNAGSVDILSIQHEYGIFGGDAGSHLLKLMRAVEVPIVTTLHTLLAEPNAPQLRAMDEIIRLSTRLVVMSEHAAMLLRLVHGVPAQKVDVIPHGILDVPFTCADEVRERLDVVGKTVILTFGLLAPDKGIEYVIDAMPAILDRNPNAVYIVLGATHPHVRAHSGEAYRTKLEARVRELGVEDSVIFHGKFVSPCALTEFLSAAEIYITPYLNPEQITSGTLAYAVGAGKAVISTPYSYARELLADGRGILVPSRDSQGIAREVIGLLSDDHARKDLQGRTAAYGRSMLWPQVARSYFQVFERAQLEFRPRPTSADVAPAALPVPVLAAGSSKNRPGDELPELNLDHVRLMTDQTGILQHAIYSVPRYEDGYCLDDNARALLLTVTLAASNLEDAKEVAVLEARYLAFVSHAFDVSSGRFRNFMSYSRVFITSAEGSEDSHGRALWALGTVVARSANSGRKRLAKSLFHSALGVVETFTSPRAWAYSLLGMEAYLQFFPREQTVRELSERLARRLLSLHQRTATPEWPWFEVQATYCNARLPQALIACGARINDTEMLTVGLNALGWLASVQRSDAGDFAPIGSNGFFQRGGVKALYDQQPVEAHSMVSCCRLAHHVTGQQRWAEEASRAFRWFTGGNHLYASLYDAQTGGCCDGLHDERVNENQGAESTLSFLLALVEMPRGRGLGATP